MAFAAFAEPIVIKEPDLSLVTSALSLQMLDPPSTRVSGVVGAADAKEPSLVWVCGHVQGKNTFGGYAQPVPFFGSLVTETTGSKQFLVISIAGPSNDDQLAVLNACLERIK
jgi:hypothetical protein